MLAVGIFPPGRYRVPTHSLGVLHEACAFIVVPEHAEIVNVSKSGELLQQVLYIAANAGFSAIATKGCYSYIHANTSLACSISVGRFWGSKTE